MERGCGCVRARESAVKSSIAQSTAACAGPAFGGGPARRQPVPPQGAEALAFTGRRTMNTRGTRPGLSPTFYRWAEPSLTVQPLGTGRPLAISAVYRGPDFPRACSSSPDTDGVLQPRKSMTMLDLLAMEPAKAAPIPERNQIKGFLTQMCARFSPQQVSHAVERGCGCVRARESAVKSSIAQSTAACAGPAFGGGPARRQPVPPQGAEALAFTGRRTMNTRGTRPGLSPTFYRWAEPSLTVQPLGTGRPLAISAVYRGPDFPRACSSSPDTDGVLQPRKSMTMLDLLAMEPAKAAPIPERNQ